MICLFRTIMRSYGPSTKILLSSKSILNPTSGIRKDYLPYVHKIFVFDDRCYCFYGLYCHSLIDQTSCSKRMIYPQEMTRIPTKFDYFQIG